MVEAEAARGERLKGAAALRAGEVLAVGNGKLLDNGDVRSLEVRVGDKVLCHCEISFSAQEIKNR